MARQFIKFCIVGGISALINFIFLYLLTEVAGWWYVYSAAVGFLLSAIFNFTSNKLWTFRNKTAGRTILTQLYKFTAVIVVGLIINTFIIYAITEWIMLDYRISWIFSTGVVTFWNFTFNRGWTFRLPSDSSSSPQDLA